MTKKATKKKRPTAVLVRDYAGAKDVNQAWIEVVHDRKTVYEGSSITAKELVRILTSVGVYALLETDADRQWDRPRED